MFGRVFELIRNPPDGSVVVVESDANFLSFFRGIPRSQGTVSTGYFSDNMGPEDYKPVPSDEDAEKPDHTGKKILVNFL